MKLSCTMTLTAALALCAALAIHFPAAAAGDAPQRSAALEPGDRGSSGAAAEAAMAQKGKQLYAEHCSHCHGFNMVTAGNVTFDLRTFPRNEKQRFLESVVNGKNDLMPPWGDALSLDDINDIWAYVLTGGKS